MRTHPGSRRGPAAATQQPSGNQEIVERHYALQNTVKDHLGIAYRWGDHGADHLRLARVLRDWPPSRGARLVQMVVGLLAAALAAGFTSSGEGPVEPRVVVAVADTGVNPYHEVYYRPENTQHPCTWVAGFDDCDIPALPLSIGQYDDVDTAYAADQHHWESVELHQWYWIPKTNIIGAVCHEDRGGSAVGELTGPPPKACILDEHGHGTGTTSTVLMENPDALLLVHEGNSGANDLRTAPVVPDIQSHSWGPPVPLPLHPFNTIGPAVCGEPPYHDETLFFLAAGNEAPFPTIADCQRAFARVQVVGGGYPGYWEARSWSTFDFASWMCRPTARHDSVSSYRESYCGTSFAAPTAAGAASSALLEIRREEDYAGGSVGDQVSATLTRDEFVEALRRGATYEPDAQYDNRPSTTSRPLPPEAPWLFWGYGWLDATVVDQIVSCALEGSCGGSDALGDAWNGSRQIVREETSRSGLGPRPLPTTSPLLPQSSPSPSPSSSPSPSPTSSSSPSPSPSPSSSPSPSPTSSSSPSPSPSPSSSPSPSPSPSSSPSPDPSPSSGTPPSPSPSTSPSTSSSPSSSPSPGGSSPAHQSASGWDVERVWGQDRVVTALAVSQRGWSSSDEVVVATGWGFADALAGGSLAARLDAPLLLTHREHLSDGVLDELRRLEARRVWLLGGTVAISQQVEDDLDARGFATPRLAGPDRFSTAAQVASAVGAPSGEAVLALGAHPTAGRQAWPDALASGALLGTPGRPAPVVLAHTDRLPDVTRRALADLGIERVTVVGGPSAISGQVLDDLRDAGYGVSRLAGSSRYGTSVATAGLALRQHPVDSVLPAVFATGQGFPDGLAAGALAARLGGVVVLVPPDDLADASEVTDFLGDHGNRLDPRLVLGGPSAISNTVRDQLTRR